MQTEISCAAIQADKHLCFSLPSLNNLSSFCIQNFKTQAGLLSVTVQSGLSPTGQKPRQQFSSNEAYMAKKTTGKPVLSCHSK